MIRVCAGRGRDACGCSEEAWVLLALGPVATCEACSSSQGLEGFCRNSSFLITEVEMSSCHSGIDTAKLRRLKIGAAQSGPRVSWAVRCLLSSDGMSKAICRISVMRLSHLSVPASLPVLGRHGFLETAPE